MGEKSREWDFEGRCPICSKSVGLLLTRLPNRKLKLEAEECPDHPGEALILWPQRDDIRYISPSGEICLYSDYSGREGGD